MNACALCHEFALAHEGLLGPLIGPVKLTSIGHHRSGGGISLHVHRLCALWSPEVYQSDAGTLKHVGAAIRRGRQIRCARCRRPGATLGCRVESCPASYHLWCAHLAGCQFDPVRFVLACPEHAQRSAHERQAPDAKASLLRATQQQGQPGIAAPQNGPTPIGEPRAGAKPPAPKRPAPDTASCMDRAGGKRACVLSEAQAAAADAHVRAARAALSRLLQEPAGNQGTTGAQGRPASAIWPVQDTDEMEWAAKERRRLAKDAARLAPTLLAGTGGRPAAEATAAALQGPGAAASSLRIWAAGDVPGFESLGGLPDVVSALREMVLLPLIRPQLLAALGIQPPRGVLMHGVPGSGKTAAVRALAGECARSAPRPVALFMRKGADCLGKYAGDAERTLRLLFAEASRLAPSIVFLDELDALAPARSARESTQDQVHASVVSTLLALLDGLQDRGQVVVIAATNRPDSLDPALRRPGRLDREIRFGLPDEAARASILSALTRTWQPAPGPVLLQRVAAATHGYAGADLQALCCGAVLSAVKHMGLCDHLSQRWRSQPPLPPSSAAEAPTDPQPGTEPTAGQTADPSPHAGSSSAERAAKTAAGDTQEGRQGPGSTARPALAQVGSFMTALSHVMGSFARPPAVHVPTAPATVRNIPDGGSPLPASALHAPAPGVPDASVPAPPSPSEPQQPDPRPRPGPCTPEVPRLGGPGGLADVVVSERDWWAALAAAPTPASRREAAALLEPAGLADPAPEHIPLLLPTLCRAVARLATPLSAALPPDVLRAARDASSTGAASVVHSSSGNTTNTTTTLAAAIEAALLRHPEGLTRAAEAPADVPSGQPWSGRQIKAAAGPPARLLLCGTSCQQDLDTAAAAIVRLLQPRAQVVALSLPALVARGHGDVTAGLLAGLAVSKDTLASTQGGTRPVVVFLPGLQGWAVQHSCSPAPSARDAHCSEEPQGSVSKEGAGRSDRDPHAAPAATPLWHLAQQALMQLWPTVAGLQQPRPLLIMCTCAAPHTSLPPSMLRFFSPPTDPTSAGLPGSGVREGGAIVAWDPPGRAEMEEALQRAAAALISTKLLPVCRRLLTNRIAPPAAPPSAAPLPDAPAADTSMQRAQCASTAAASGAPRAVQQLPAGLLSTAEVEEATRVLRAVRARVMTGARGLLADRRLQALFALSGRRAAVATDGEHAASSSPAVEGAPDGMPGPVPGHASTLGRPADRLQTHLAALATGEAPSVDAFADPILAFLAEQRVAALKRGCAEAAPNAVSHAARPAPPARYDIVAAAAAALADEVEAFRSDALRALQAMPVHVQAAVATHAPDAVRAGIQGGANLANLDMADTAALLPRPPPPAPPTLPATAHRVGPKATSIEALCQREMRLRCEPAAMLALHARLAQAWSEPHPVATAALDAAVASVARDALAWMSRRPPLDAYALSGPELLSTLERDLVAALTLQQLEDT